MVVNMDKGPNKGGGGVGGDAWSSIKCQLASKYAKISLIDQTYLHGIVVVKV
jgi:hypothetical protein